jgi:eukaryotic-like serine/threonine-protein kinase
VVVLAAFVLAALLAGGALAANTVWGSDSPSGVQATDGGGDAVGPIVETTGPTAVDVTVPDVSELTRADAEAKLRDAGLEPAYADPVSDDDVEMDSVVKQDPAAGETVSEGDEVTLTLSSGAEPIELIAVPDVVGDTEATAEGELTEAGFDVQVRREESSSVAAGKVVRTEPSSGTKVRLGGVVELVVSLGAPEPEPDPDPDPEPQPDLVAVPSDLLGQQYDLAQAALRDYNFGVSRTDEPSTEFAAGVVIGTSPSSGELVPRGTVVNLTVSSGPPAGASTVTVPNVVGLTRMNAEAALKAAQLVPVADSTWDYYNTTVSRTDPTAGTTVTAGSQVTFFAAYPPR